MSCSCNSCSNKIAFCTSSINLFKDLPMEVQAHIVSNVTHFEANANQIIIREGQKAEHMLIIREGKVKLNKFDSEGKEYILDILISGDTIGEDSFMQKELFDYNVETLSHSKFCQISKKQILDLVYENSQFAVSFVELLCKKLTTSNDKINLLMSSSAYKRIVTFILERDQRLNGKPISLTVDDIAASTNLRRETVSRKLRDLQKDNVIKRTGQKKLEIINRKKLFDIFYEN